MIPCYAFNIISEVTIRATIIGVTKPLILSVKNILEFNTIMTENPPVLQYQYQSNCNLFIKQYQLLFSKCQRLALHWFHEIRVSRMQCKTNLV